MIAANLAGVFALRRKFRHVYQLQATKAMATPLHLCQNSVSSSYPPSRDRKRPIKAVTTALTAADNSNPSPVLRNKGLLFACTAVSHTTAASSSTMGKCRSRGCILPATCNATGTCSCALKRAKNSNRQFRAKQRWLKKALQRCPVIR